MGLYNWLRTKVTGVDIDATQADLNTSDARLRDLNSQALASGRYDQATYDLATAHWYQGRITDAGGEVNAAAAAGLDQGITNVSDAIRSFINIPSAAAAKLIFKSIPLWLWFTLLIAALWYFGILQRLLQRVKSA